MQCGERGSVSASEAEEHPWPEAFSEALNPEDFLAGLPLPDGVAGELLLDEPGVGLCSGSPDILEGGAREQPDSEVQQEEALPANLDAEDINIDVLW